MDKSEIIERLKNIAGHAVYTVGAEPFVMSLDDGIAVHEAIKLLTNCSEIPDSWIPCSERLPEEGYEVFITKKPFKIKGFEQEVITAKRSVDPRSGKIEWWSPEFGSLTDKSVLAWMEKPKPWKGEADGQTN